MAKRVANYWPKRLVNQSSVLGLDRAFFRNIPIKLVTASRGKAVRAEPIAHLYARGEVDHAAPFEVLEQQATEMTTAGYMGQRSPDRLDAMVWALSELSQGSQGISLMLSDGTWI